MQDAKVGDVDIKTEKTYFLLHGTSSFHHAVDHIMARCSCELDRLHAAIFTMEALTNAFVHGNSRDSGKPILLTACTRDQFLEIEVVDCGEGIEEHGLRDETIPDPLQESGRGFFLIRHYADDLSFAGSTVTIRKRLCNID